MKNRYRLFLIGLFLTGCFQTNLLCMEPDGVALDMRSYEDVFRDKVLEKVVTELNLRKRTGIKITEEDRITLYEIIDSTVLEVQRNGDFEVIEESDIANVKAECRLLVNETIRSFNTNRHILFTCMGNLVKQDEQTQRSHKGQKGLILPWAY